MLTVVVVQVLEVKEEEEAVKVKEEAVEVKEEAAVEVKEEAWQGEEEALRVVEEAHPDMEGPGKDFSIRMHEKVRVIQLKHCLNE